jgi:hypothetical protein
VFGTVSGFRTVPGDRAPWDDVSAVFGRTGYPAHCWCQRFKLDWHGLNDSPDEVKEDMLRDQCSTGPDVPPPGLLGYRDDAPVGWVAVEPRVAAHRLPAQRLDLKRRGEDREDPEIWAVTCFVVRVGHRGTRLCYDLLGAAVEHARSSGARALEGYPMITKPGEDITWGETHVGTRSMFTALGFDEVGHPTKRRVVMRMDF